MHKRSLRKHHATTQPTSLLLPAAMAPSVLIALVVCLQLGAASVFALQTAATGPSKSPTTNLAQRHLSSAFVVSARGQSRWTSARGRRRRRAACSMSVESSNSAGRFDPLGFGSQVGATGWFNQASRCGLQRESTSERNSNRRGRGLGETTLNAIHVGADDVGPDPRESRPALGSALGKVKGLEGAGDGSVVQEGETPKGWDYWGYRVLLIGVAAIWGTNFPVVKFVESHAAVSDATAAFVRFSIAAAAMLPFADWTETEVLLAGMEIGFWVAVGYFTQAIGLQTSDASVCAFLCSLTVVFVPLFDTLAGKGIKLVTIGASLLALLGTGFLELGDAHSSWNDLWCVAQAAGFGMAFTRIEESMKKFPGKSLQLSIGQLISVAGLTGVWCAYSSGGHIPDFSFMKDPSIAAALGYTGLVTTSLAVWLETVALEHVPASEMSVIFSTEPLWATLVSRLFLKETMGPNAAVGAGFILLACLTAQSEQIQELLGMGGAATDTELDAVAEGGEGVEESFPRSVLDELDPMVGSEGESTFTMSLIDEYAVPTDMYAEGAALGGKGANLSGSGSEPPAVRVGWFASVGNEEMHQ